MKWVKRKWSALKQACKTTYTVVVYYEMGIIDLIVLALLMASWMIYQTYYR